MSAIFISHSSADNEAATKLVQRLEEQGHHSVFLDFDPEQGIPAGTIWEQVLYAKLRACRAVIVLCSPHSMASKWCFAEITHARSLGKALFPVIVAPCDLQSVFSDTQTLNLAEESDYQRLWNGLKEAGLEDVFEWDGVRDPYPGLNAFQEQDAALFFGRSEDIRKSIGLLGNIRRTGAERMLLYLGASGSGKSSLVRAGLIPQLKKDQNNWIVIDPFRPNELLGDPYFNLASVLSAGFKRYETTTEINTIHQQLLQQKQRSHPLLQLACSLAVAADKREASVLIFIDQFEELLSSNAKSDTEHSFVAWLADAINQAEKIPSCPLIIITTVRSDFFVDLQGTSALQQVDYAEYSVRPIPKSSLGELIEGPARLVGLELEPGLVPQIIEDIETQNALPLLAFTLAELWKRYGQDGDLTLTEYQQLGGVRGSVKRAAEDAFAKANLDQQQKIDLRRAFLAMVQIGEGNQYRRKKAELNELPVAALPMLEKLVKTRLLVKNEAGNSYEVAHEALFQEWDLISNWLTENREFLGWRRRFQSDLQKWEDLQHDEGTLLRGALLAEAELWFKNHQADLTEKEQSFFTESIGLRDREEHAHLEQQHKEQKAKELELRQAKELAEAEKAHAEEQASTAQRLRRYVFMLVVVFIISVAASLFAWNAKIIANQSAEKAKFATQAAQGARISALVLIPGKATESLLLAIELVAPSISSGWTLPDQAFKGLVDAIKAVGYAVPRDHTLQGHNGSVESVAFSPDGSRIITTGKDHTVRLWDAKNIKLLKSYERPDSYQMPGITSSAFSPGGRRIVIAGKDRAAIVLDAHSGDELMRLEDHNGDVAYAAFSADGTRIITAGGVDDGTVRLWDAKTGQKIRSFVSAGAVLFAVLSPNGKLLASGGQRQQTLLWNTLTGERINELDEGDWVKSGVFSPDGHSLLTSTERGVTLWNVDTGVAIRRSYAVRQVDIHSFSKKMIVMGSEVLKLSGSNDLLTTFPRHSGNNVDYAALSRDSQLAITTTTADSTARVWNTNTGKLSAILEGHSKTVNSAAFSPGGRRVVTASSDGTARLWQLLPKDLSLLFRRARRKTEDTVVAAPNGNQHNSVSDKAGTLNKYPASIEKYFSLACNMLRYRLVFEKVSELCFINDDEENILAAFSGADLQQRIRHQVAKAIIKEGNVLGKKGQIEAAIVKYNAALTVYPGLKLNPEKEAKRMAAPSIVEEGKRLAKKGEIEAAVVLFEKALVFDPNLKLEPEIKAKRLAVPSLVREGILLAKTGKIIAALETFSVLQTYDPKYTISEKDWYSLCWHGSLRGFAKEVMYVCDKAVEMATVEGRLNQFHEGRGLARALTGDLPGALEDFQYYLENRKMAWMGRRFLSEEKIRQFKEWIEKLQAKQNPFNETVLKQLWGDG